MNMKEWVRYFSLSWYGFTWWITVQFSLMKLEEQNLQTVWHFFVEAV